MKKYLERYRILYIDNPILSQFFKFKRNPNILKKGRASYIFQYHIIFYQ